MIGVSGMGRIGRLLVRRLFSSPASSLRLKVINSVYPVETVAHLLKYDTVHGTWDADVSVKDEDLIINGQAVKMTYERDPANIPWKDLGVTTVLDATGKFNDREGSMKHIASGAKKVIITAPGKNMDLTVVMGVNDKLYDPAKHQLLSAASCTTNCVSPLLAVLDDAFQIESGWMTTVHAYTSDQKHLDNPHKDLRRARACTQSIVPTTTGVGQALVDVLPHLAPKVQGISLRVPTQDVSIVDLTVQIKETTTIEEVRNLYRAASTGKYANVVGYTDEPLVSMDFVGNPKSTIVDGLSVMAMGNQIKVLGWYDNEWGYSCRVIDLAELVEGRMAEACQTAAAL